MKSFADSFHETDLEKVLSGLHIDHLILSGMMTQNCVTHTAVSKAAEKYKISVVPEACTTVSELIHNIAVSALAPRKIVTPLAEAFLK